MKKHKSVIKILKDEEEFGVKKFKTYEKFAERN